MFVECPKEVQQGETLRVSFAVPGQVSEPVECWARVAWVNAAQPRLPHSLPRGFGLEFRKLSPPAKKSLNDFLARQGASSGG
jgi:hypothetical protein